MLLRLLFTTLFLFFSSALLAFDEAKVASSLGLELVSEGHPYNFLGVTSIYVNDNMSRQMLVVSNVDGELKAERIFHHKGFLIYEIPKSQSSYVSIAFVGINEDEIKAKLITTSVWKKLLHELNPLPKAYGNDCALPGTAALNGIANLATHYGSSIWKSSLKCIDQIKDSLKSSAVEELEDLKTLFSDPVKFWEKKVAALKNVGNLITQFDVKIKEMSAALTNLPPDILGTFICGFIGGMGTRVLLSLLSGGAGTAKLLLSLEGFVTKLIRLEKVFSVLGKAGKLRNIPKSFMEKLSLGKIPESTLESIETLAKYDFPDFIEGAMACSM